jgi:hypothetical protein
MTAKTRKQTPQFVDFIEWVEEKKASQIKERLTSTSMEYGLSVVEGIENGKRYPEAAVNLRFQAEFIFEMDCLEIECEEIKDKSN